MIYLLFNSYCARIRRKRDGVVTRCETRYGFMGVFRSVPAMVRFLNEEERKKKTCHTWSFWKSALPPNDQNSVCGDMQVTGPFIEDIVAKGLKPFSYFDGMVDHGMSSGDELDEGEHFSNVFAMGYR